MSKKVVTSPALAARRREAMHAMNLYAEAAILAVADHGITDSEWRVAKQATKLLLAMEKLK